MMTSEQLTVNPDVGSIDAFGPINYKIPGIRNIPKDFNVSLLKEAAGGHKDLYSSKVGLLHQFKVGHYNVNVSTGAWLLWKFISY